VAHAIQRFMGVDGKKGAMRGLGTEGGGTTDKGQRKPIRGGVNRLGGGKFIQAKVLGGLAKKKGRGNRG